METKKMYKKITSSFLSHADGLTLYYCAWIATEFDSQKCVVIHHGHGEHSGRYQNVLEAFAGSGYSFFLMDMRGHGQSEGRRGAAPDFDHYLMDLMSFIDLLKDMYNVQRPVLMGHSLGGLITIAFCFEEQGRQSIRALVANASPLEMVLTPMMKVKRMIGRGLVTVSPEIRAAVGLPLKYISHDKNVIRVYRDDPLVHGMMGIRLAEEILSMASRCMGRASEFSLPVLLTHGSQDGIANPVGTQKFYHRCGSDDKTLILYDGLYHEVYNEIKKDKPLDDLRDWIECH